MKYDYFYYILCAVAALMGSKKRLACWTDALTIKIQIIIIWINAKKNQWFIKSFHAANKLKWWILINTKNNSWYTFQVRSHRKVCVTKRSVLFMLMRDISCSLLNTLHNPGIICRSGHHPWLLRARGSSRGIRGNSEHNQYLY